MVPYVFVSSTIEDLHHLRDAVRDAIVELAYNPVMSEYGDIGYLPTKSAVDSAYSTMRECQIAVVILGKRYGSLGDDGRSITHSEILAARDARVPIVCLVDRETLTYKKIFEANRTTSINVPGMDAAGKTFQLIDEIARAATNNAVLGFGTVSEARSLLKGQLAHMVGDLLRRGQDPVKADVREVLTELKTLRHELTAGPDRQAPLFMRAIRFLLDESNSPYREVVEALFETIEAATPTLLQCATFDDAIVKAVGGPPTLVDLSSWNEIQAFLTANDEGLAAWYLTGPEEQADEPLASFIAVDLSRSKCFLNNAMLLDARHWHDEFRAAVATG